MTLFQPPVFIAAKHELHREHVGSVLPWQFDRWSVEKKPVQPSMQRPKDRVGGSLQSGDAAQVNFAVNHALCLRILSAKGHPLRMPR